MRTPVMSPCLACIVLFINFLSTFYFIFSLEPEGEPRHGSCHTLPYNWRLCIAAAEIRLEQRVTPVTERHLKQCERRSELPSWIIAQKSNRTWMFFARCLGYLHLFIVCHVERWEKAQDRLTDSFFLSLSLSLMIAKLFIPLMLARYKDSWRFTVGYFVT